MFSKQNIPYDWWVSCLPLLHKRIRRLRLEMGLTQESFAEKFGFSYKYYQKVESGRKKQIWLETVERLAKAFGLEAWQLISPTEPKLKKKSPSK